MRELLGVVAESVLDELVEAIATQSAERALGLVHRLIADGQNLQHFCREAIRHFRNLLVARVCGADSDLVAAPPDERPRLAEQAARFTEEDLTRFFQILLATDDDLRRKPDPRLHLELGLLQTGQCAASRASRRNSRRTARRIAARRAQDLRAHRRSIPPRSVSAVSIAPHRASGDGHRNRRANGAAQAAPETKLDSTICWSTLPRRQPRICHLAPRTVPTPMPASPPRIVARAAEDATGGLASAQVDAIKAALQGQKFLWSMVEHATRWEIDGGELRLFFPTESRALAEMLQARDPMERLRTVLNQVVGQPLRVCVKLESGRAAVVGRGSELRARFEEDPIVRAMLEKFGGQISKIKRPGEE